jgi:hypothetical protein
MIPSLIPYIRDQLKTMETKKRSSKEMTNYNALDSVDIKRKRL